MNRRRFIQSLAAIFTLPATGASLSLGSATAAIPTAAAVPAQARFWGIYMSALHGECPPHALQSILNIPEVDAKRYVGQLIADGVIKPNPLLQRSVSKILKSNEDSFLDKVKNRSEMKARANSDEVKIAETAETAETVDSTIDTPEQMDDETKQSEDLLEGDLEVFSEDESVEAIEAEVKILDETGIQS